tara:strand:- start:5065 stop:6195 length:1131 start_codon:yes stop_codon:yes gene_type:complete
LLYIFVTLILLIFSSFVTLKNSYSFDSIAKQVILVDDLTGTILYSKNSSEQMHPASMSKLMTIYIAFELVKEGKLNLEDKFLISEKAWRMGGSRMFLEAGKYVTVRNLLDGIIVQSGNDACIVLAEGISGSETGFTDLMNKKAKNLGLKNTYFENSTGWPHPKHLTTANDLAILSHKIIHDFPQYYKSFSKEKFKYNNISQGNRNPLLNLYPGADGLKTGYTEASGYGLAASAIRSGRRLILVANGMESAKIRKKETSRILDYGFSNFANYNLFTSGDVVDQIEVWLGEKDKISLVVDEDITVTLSRAERETLRVFISAPGPIGAPIKKGQIIAKLNINIEGKNTKIYSLSAGYDVDKLSSFQRIGAAFNQIIWGN